MNVVSELMDVQWTLDSGLALVRLLQPHTRQFGYHLAIGGGVVNRGYSTKDLDLYFLPLDDNNANRRADPHKLRVWLESLWGPASPIIGDPYSASPARYTHKLKFHVAGRRVDAFIV